jgi:hypothetical protein
MPPAATARRAREFCRRHLFITELLVGTVASALTSGLVTGMLLLLPAATVDRPDQQIAFLALASGLIQLAFVTARFRAR